MDGSKINFFRSKRMRLCKLILHKENAFDCLLELGYLGKVKFVFDLNYFEIRRDDEYLQRLWRSTSLLRIVRNFQKELNELGMTSVFDANVDQEHRPNIRDLEKIENVVTKLNAKFFENIKTCRSLIKKWLDLEEFQGVLVMADRVLIGKGPQVLIYDTMLSNLLQNHPTSSQIQDDLERVRPLSFICGTVPIRNFEKFETMIWRVSLGNAVLKREIIHLSEFINDPTDSSKYKFAFVLTFFGNEMLAKLMKVCSGFAAKVFPSEVLPANRAKNLQKIANDLADVKKVYSETLAERERMLKIAASELYIWRSKLNKFKTIYYTLSRMRYLTDDKYLVSECWIPKNEIFDVRRALLRGARAANDMHTKFLIFPPILNIINNIDQLPVPTEFDTNKYTQVFQDLVDTFGIANYRELNPAPFYIITFPFLFGVMFGDIGHGMILVLLSLVLIHYEENLAKYQSNRAKEDALFDLLFSGRYLILLMGVFAIYAGLIFNTFFSKPINIFGSTWSVNFTQQEIEDNDYLQLDPARMDHFVGYPYPVGLDPIWGSWVENYFNINTSLRMKVSIVVGVAHLMFGLCLSGVNALYFKNTTDLYLKFLPQVIFMCCIFLYLVAMIFQKWFTFGGHRIKEFSPGCAPSLFIQFINMLLFMSNRSRRSECAKHMFSFQAGIEYLLVSVAIACVVVLLFGYPIQYLFQFHRDKIDTMRRTFTVGILRKTQSPLAFQANASMHNIFDRSSMSDVLMKQFIDTIENLMGMISHTASYFRVWAVSLAHDQLSVIIYNCVLRSVLKTQHGFLWAPLISIGFAVFAVFTVAFLIILEGVAAFLHALRLHWFEFNSKFYSGNGLAFMPFYFQPSKKTDAET